MNKSGYCESMWRRWRRWRRWSFSETLTLPRSPVSRKTWIASRNDEIYRCELDLERFMQDALDTVNPGTDLWDFCNRIVMIRRMEITAQRDFLDSVKAASQFSRVYSLRQITEAQNEAYRRGRKEALNWFAYCVSSIVVFSVVSWWLFLR